MSEYSPIVSNAIMLQSLAATGCACPCHAYPCCPGLIVRGSMTLKQGMSAPMHCESAEICMPKVCLAVQPCKT